MSKIEDLEKEISELREELSSTRMQLRNARLDLSVVEMYLESLSSRRYWNTKDRRLARIVPFWSFFHPIRALFKQPFSVWSIEAKEDLEAKLEQTAEEDAKGWAEFRKGLTYTVDDGKGGRKEVQFFPHG